MIEFGSVEQVPIRTVWPHEEHDFTPWLADNLERLGEVLGLELELDEIEVPVGSFSLDLLARDLGADRSVVIENQFGPTDHDHLGKLLTYASGFDAGVVIWIGESIREQHRQALDWLNRRTDSDTHFFAVEIEVIRIDDSKPAYHFKPIVFPNEWQKLRSVRGDHRTSERAEAYREYFQQLIDTLRENHHFTTARRGQPQSWYSFGAGVSGVAYSASFAQGGRARAELYIGTKDGDFNLRLYKWLESHRSTIESEFGKPLEWEQLEDRLASRIAVYTQGSIDETDMLEELIAWHEASLLRFREVFGERLRDFKDRGSSGPSGS